MWDECRKFGVAAIGYRPLWKVDLSKMDISDRDKIPDKLLCRWDKLEAAPKGSLRKVVCEMKQGDIIYVKQGPQIVGKGIVTGPYTFNADSRIARRPDGFAWEHEVPVDWDPSFRPISVLLGSELTTVLCLKGQRLQKLKAAIRNSGQKAC